jgi:translation initiation factor 2 alpha subunit (eIF-2alpha)
VHINKTIIAQVIGKNEEKNFVELSIKSVDSSDTENFIKSHSKYSTIYNLWRYVCLRLNYDYSYEINAIPEEEIQLFMEKTLWAISDKLLETTEELDYGDIYSKLLNPETNVQLINLTTIDDKTLVKNILDNLGEKKIVRVKQNINTVFKVQSFEPDGLSDIKYALNYLDYQNINELQKKYSIEILYLSGSKYSLNIKELEITTDEEDTQNIKFTEEKIIEEIISRCKEKNIMYSQ